MPRFGRFNLNAKIYFLKYPHCSLTKEEALSQLQSISTTTNKNYIKICRELHENGEPRLHALIQFEGKIQFSHQSLFDLFSPNRSSRFHPNIQVAKSSSDFKSFIDKDGDTVEWGEIQISSRGVQQTRNEVFVKAVNTGNKEQALETIKELAPRDFCIYSHTITSNLDRIFAPTIPPFQPEWPFSSFIMPPELQEWINLNFVAHPDSLFRYSLRGDVDRPLSVVIEGDSRTGKTAWARSIGKHNYHHELLDFSPEIYSNEAHYNVIDNVSPKYLKKKHWKELLGAKSDWQANCRHGKPVMIKGGIPSIVLCNPGKGSSYKDFLDKKENHGLLQWTTKNVIFITLQEPLYSTAKSNTQNSPGQEDT